ncbi:MULTISPECIES: hypothetical protein [unclassified Arthrobacter]|uniref:hypothetical protein n=1 Tax=unclassified Arthrobacter TaxID=235627 RepID=UPI000CE39B52|nr:MULTISPECIES: hypothetical protein [unclassified Arthrobacter]
MKSLRALKATGLILAAVVLGLMTVQGSYALWNAAVPSNAGTVQSADFNIVVNGENMSTMGKPLLQDFGYLKPGSPVTRKITVSNLSNATSGMKVQPILNFLPGDLGQLILKHGFEDKGICQYDGFGTISQGDQQVLCIEVQLPTEADRTQLGQKVNIPISLTVAQVAPGTK